MMIPRIQLLLFLGVLLLACSPVMGLAGEQTPQPVPQLQDLERRLEEQTPRIEQLLGEEGWSLSQIIREMDSLDEIANRIYYLSKEIDPMMTAPLLGRVVRLFQDICQSVMAVMESSQLQVMEDEEALEALYRSQRWKELEVVISLANYRLNKAKYYWALLQPKDSAERRRYLQEASEGFLNVYNIVYENPQLTAYSFLGRALCLRELGDYSASIQELDYIIDEQAQGLPPLIIGRARLERAKTYLLAGKMDNCLKDLNDLLSDQSSISPDPGLLNRARLLKLRVLRDISNNPETLTQHQAISRNLHQDLISLIRELSKEGTYWQQQMLFLLSSASVMEDLWKESQKDPYVGWLLAEKFFQEKRFKEALPLFKSALSHPESSKYLPQARLSLKLGICYYNLRMFKEAIPYLSHCIQRTKQSEEREKAAYLRYRSYENLYKEKWNRPYLRAIRYYLKNFPLHRYASDAHYRLGKYYAQQGKRGEAIRELNKVRKGSRYYPQARFYIFKYRTEEFEQARRRPDADIKRLYRAALQAREDFLAASPSSGASDLQGYATLLSARLFLHGPEQRYRQVLKILTDFEQRYPHKKRLFLPVSLVRIEAFQRLKDLKNAKREVKRVLHRYGDHPKAPEALSILAERFVEAAEKGSLENLEIAIFIYEGLLSTGNVTGAERESMLYSLADLYLRVGRYQRAKEIYQAFYSQDQQSVKALYGLGNIAELEGRDREALEYWRTLEEILPVGEDLWYEAKYKMARIYYRLGDHRRSCKILTTTRILHPSLGGDRFKERFLRLEKEACSAR